MNTADIVLLYTVGLPLVVRGHVYGLLSLVFGIGERPHYRHGIFRVWSRGWVQQRWNFCTTLAAWMLLPSWFNRRTEEHEETHVRQYVELCALGLALSGVAMLLGVKWWIALAVFWGTSGEPWLLPQYVLAVIRYKRPGVTWMQAGYYAAMFEQHAYAWTKTFFDGQLDPWEHHRDKSLNMDGSNV